LEEMKEVIINFESENKDGVVAVGTYLIDAARRLGIFIESDCAEAEEGHECAMKISSGKNLLSAPTKVEMEQLSSQARKMGERLSCQAKIEKPGEITVMSVKKQQAKKTTEEEKKDNYRKEFEDLPLGEKISNLVELEAITLGETLSYVLDSPYKAVGKVMNVMSDFGLKMDRDDEDAKRPEEHKSDQSKDSKATPRKKPAKKKTTTRKRAATKRSAKKSSTKPATDESADKKEDG